MTGLKVREVVRLPGRFCIREADKGERNVRFIHGDLKDARFLALRGIHFRRGDKSQATRVCCVRDTVTDFVEG